VAPSPTLRASISISPSRRHRRLDDDVVALLSKRVYDMAGVLGKTVKVSLNGERGDGGCDWWHTVSGGGVDECRK
jgi:hypothetical protein